MLIAMIAELRCNSLLDGVQGGLRGVQLLSNINSKCDGAARQRTYGIVGEHQSAFFFSGQVSTTFSPRILADLVDHIPEHNDDDFTRIT